MARITRYREKTQHFCQTDLLRPSTALQCQLELTQRANTGSMSLSTGVPNESGELQMGHCTRCGRDLADGAAFCIQCGEPTPAAARAQQGVATGAPAQAPISAWESPAPIPHETTSPRNRTAAIAAITVVLLAGGAYLVLGVGGEKHTVTGDMNLTANNNLSTGASCTGTGGYSDIAPGTQIVIEDDSGKTLATSSFGPGTYDGQACVFDFTFDNVTKSAFYRVHQNGNRGVLQYSYQNMVDNDWSVHLTLGS